MDMNHPEEWDEFFYDENVQKFKEKKIGLMGSPIRKIGNDKYTFIHKSFLEYFVAKKMIKEIENETEINKQIMNKKLLVSGDSGDVSIVRFFINHLEENVEISNKLLNIIMMSKEKENITIAAANAVSILIWSKFSFRGMDLSNLNIQGKILNMSQRAIGMQSTFNKYIEGF